MRRFLHSYIYIYRRQKYRLIKFVEKTSLHKILLPEFYSRTIIIKRNKR